MTSDEAIKIFNTVLAFGKCDCSKDKIIQAFDMAIEALREHQHYKDLAESYEKTINKLTKAIAEQQSSKDYISRKAVLDGLASIAKAKAKSDEQKSLMGRAIFFTEQLSSVIPQPKEESQQKKGHWIEHKHGGIEHIECSKCHVWFLRGHLTRNTYCPECGSYNGGAKK